MNYLTPCVKLLMIQYMYQFLPATTPPNVVMIPIDGMEVVDVNGNPIQGILYFLFPHESIFVHIVISSFNMNIVNGNRFQFEALPNYP